MNNINIKGAWKFSNSSNIHHANIVQAVKTCYKIKINYRESKSCFYGFFPASKPLLPTIKSHTVPLASHFYSLKALQLQGNS